MAASPLLLHAAESVCMLVDGLRLRALLYLQALFLGSLALQVAGAILRGNRALFWALDCAACLAVTGGLQSCLHGQDRTDAALDAAELVVCPCKSMYSLRGRAPKDSAAAGISPSCCMARHQHLADRMQSFIANIVTAARQCGAPGALHARSGVHVLPNHLLERWMGCGRRADAGLLFCRPSVLP